MTQKSKLFKKMMIGFVIGAVPVMLCNFGSTQGNSLFDTKPEVVSMSPVHKDKIKIGVTKAPVTVEMKGSVDREYQKNTYIAKVNNKLPNTSSYIRNHWDISDVPDKYEKSFVLRIITVEANQYSAPLETAKLKNNSNIKKIYETNDLTVYNSNFIKVKSELGRDVYVNTDKAVIDVVPTKDFRIINTGNDVTITDKVKNINFDLTSKTNLTAAEISTITKGTGLEGIENAVIDIEETYGINALFTISLAINESGWGESYLARTRNNLFGICAFDNDLDAASHFASKDECVRYWGKLISEEYFANGRYDLESINAIYASSPTWAYTVRNIMHGIANEL